MIGLFNESKLLQVLKIFFVSPEKKFTIRELAKLTKISPAWASKTVFKLKKEELLIIDETKRVTANLESKEFFNLKKIFNLRSMSESGLIDYLVSMYHEPECIILFGSYSNGADIGKSDIDIAIITNRKLNLDLIKFEKTLNRKINLHEVSLNKCGSEFKNSIINGIILYGYLKVL